MPSVNSRRLNRPRLASDTRRATLDYLSQFHLATLLILFPDEAPAVLCRRFDIADLTTELHARTLRAEADRLIVERQIAEARDRSAEAEARRKAEKRAKLAPFLTRPTNG